MSKTIFCMAPLRWWAGVYVCPCLSLCVCVCMCPRPRLHPNWLWLRFHRIFSRRKEELGPDGEMGSEGETHLPFPDTFPSGLCGHHRTHTHTHAHVQWMVSSTTQGITNTNEVWERDKEKASGKQVDHRNGSRERKRSDYQSRCRAIDTKGRAGEELSEQKFVGREESESW